MIYKRFAVGLFPWARLRLSLVCVLRLCTRNVLRRVPKINTGRSEGRSGQTKELNCDVNVSPTGSPGAETALSYLEQRSQGIMHPLFFPTPRFSLACSHLCLLLHVLMKKMTLPTPRSLRVLGRLKPVITVHSCKLLHWSRCRDTSFCLFVFGLHWVFTALLGRSLVTVSGGYCLIVVCGFLIAVASLVALAR